MTANEVGLKEFFIVQLDQIRADIKELKVAIEKTSGAIAHKDLVIQIGKDVKANEARIDKIEAVVAIIKWIGGTATLILVALIVWAIQLTFG